MVRGWLYCSAALVLIMILIGGLTRLSDAGLSIVEWKPVTGIIPPLSDLSWQEEFAKYQNSPEYRLINHHMSLAEFQRIFWLEFVHRIAARITGLVICLPLIFFYLTGKLPFKTNKSYLLLPLLLIGQGVMGWYMVKSGLVKDPHVSHFRLAAHMMLAIILYTLIIFKLFKIEGLVRLQWTAIGLLYIQIFLGALVAGLDAGLIYNTFPRMGGQLIPSEIYSAPNIFMDAAAVQFMHRSMAYIVTFVCLSLAYNKRSLFILLAIIFQVATGLITLLYHVPFLPALLHQLGAAILLTSIILKLNF